MRRHITRERERSYLNHKHVKGYVNYRLTQIAEMEIPDYSHRLLKKHIHTHMLKYFIFFFS